MHPPVTGPCIVDVLPIKLIQIIVAQHLPSESDYNQLGRSCRALHSLTASAEVTAAWMWRWHGEKSLTVTLAGVPANRSQATARRLVEVHHADVNHCPLAGREGITVLDLAFAMDRLDFAAYFLSVFGVDVNKRDEKGRTPLSRWVPDLKPTRLLLAHPLVDVNVPDTDGATCRHHATCAGAPDT